MLVTGIKSFENQNRKLIKVVDILGRDFSFKTESNFYYTSKTMVVLKNIKIKMKQFVLILIFPIFGEFSKLTFSFYPET